LSRRFRALQAEISIWFPGHAALSSHIGVGSTDLAALKLFTGQA
jgi:hypothetical protein